MPPKMQHFSEGVFDGVCPMHAWNRSFALEKNYNLDLLFVFGATRLENQPYTQPGSCDQSVAVLERLRY